MALFTKVICRFLSESSTCSQRQFVGRFQRCLATQGFSNGTHTKEINSTPNESEKYTKEHRKRMANYYSLFIGSLVGIAGSSFLIYKKLTTAEAKALEDSVKEEVVEMSSGSLHKSQAGFKERKIIEYENRIRAYSTPDKIFRYFATLQDTKTGDIYMTPEDFVRALTPDTMQPKGLGLDQFKKFDAKHIPPYVCPFYGSGSVFHCLGEGGLVSFSDYVFLLTVLGTSARHIEIAFKMFDLNGDGEVTIEEFKKVRSLFLSMTTTGSRHRDRSTTGNVLHGNVNTGLAAYLFGVDGSGKLTSEEFVQFKRRLQEEVMYLEFVSFQPKNGLISERQFAEILLTYANFGNAKKNKIIKGIEEVYGKQNSEKHIGVTFQDYLNFFSFLLNIRDVEMALSFHTVAGQSVSKGTLKQVAKTVAGVDLRDHLVDIVFSIFDENGDDELSNKEFIAVMKDKMFRGLNKPKDTGFTRFLSAIYACAKSNIIESWTTPDHTH
ncbi:calcium uptake protein 1, mitochondrial-like [Hydractinia symbiolongicarpus]|uniref:calcium uptake protein 1, mitochondrial-like n=1 Tax=Hydractinia symbiolongicarpus TaxID=13093 RepID=UPI002551444C|nr:calcium uptake protein 1, mitochondrial-like [Hydractinia symbiolongicarpus]